MEVPEKKARKPNWTEVEMGVLAEAYTEYVHVIRGKLSPALTTDMKKKAWETITDRVNSVAWSCRRTVDETKKRFQDSQLIVKKKESHRKRETRTTGGGPMSEVNFKPWEVTILNNIPKEAIHGLEGAVDIGPEENPKNDQTGAMGDCLIQASHVTECVIDVEADHEPVEQEPCSSRTLMLENHKVACNGSSKKGSKQRNEQNSNRLEELIEGKGLKNVILKAWPNIGRNFSKVQMPVRPTFMEIILKDNNGSRKMYDTLLNEISSKPKSEDKWKRILNLPDNFDWKKANLSVFHCTYEIKLRWLHYRITHRILGTNYLLYKFKIRNDPNCSLCDTFIETIEHLFFYCRHSKNLWQHVEDWVKSVNIDVSIDIRTVLFGSETIEYAPINLIIMIIEQYIFQRSRKNNELSFPEVKEKIAYEYSMENTMYSLKLESEKFKKRWGPFRALFEG